MGSQQRPATVIGFASASSTASTPESQPSNSMVKFYFIPLSLEVAIERLPKFTSLVSDVIFEVAQDTNVDPSKEETHLQLIFLFLQISHESDSQTAEVCCSKWFFTEWINLQISRRQSSF